MASERWSRRRGARDPSQMACQRRYERRACATRAGRVRLAVLCQSPVSLTDARRIQEAVRITSTENSQYRWADWVKTKGNRHRLVIFNAVISQWAGSGIISSYLSLILKTIGITSAVQRQGINGGMSLVTLAYCIPLSMYIERFSRRALWLWSTVFMIVW
jgi:hypothetical protein